MAPTWSAPVRFAEVDAQGIVFNAHYLLYCDEALSAYFAERALLQAAAHIRLVASTLTWSGSARWGDTVEVYATCTKIGRTSLVIAFDVRAGGATVCSVETTYVHADAAGTPQPVPDAMRSALGNPG